MVLNHVVFSFVCFLFLFCVCIFQSFLVSHQIEFVVLLNKSFITLRTNCMSSDLCAGYMSSSLYKDYAQSGLYANCMSYGLCTEYVASGLLTNYP